MKDKIVNFLKETLAEMKKVTWPDRRYVMVATTIVLILVFLSSLFIVAVDFGLGKIFTALMR